MIRLLKGLGLVWVCLLLSGCPTDFQELESLYYDNQFIPAAIQAGSLSDDRRYHRSLNTFLSRHHTYFFRHLSTDITDSSTQPTRETILELNTLDTSLQRLHSHFPDYLTQDRLDTLTTQIATVQATYQSTLLTAIDQALSRAHYRRAIGYCDDLIQTGLATDTTQPLVSSLRQKSHRHLMLNPVYVHDHTIEQLIDQFNQSPEFFDDPSATDLMADTINVPKTFQRFLSKDLSSLSSEFLTPTPHPSSPVHYAVSSRIGIVTTQDPVPQQRDITNTFHIKYANDPNYYAEDLTYAVYVSTTTIHAVVDAVSMLYDGQEPLGRYLFETLATTETYTLGDITNLPIDADDIRYPAEYQHYQTQSVAKPRSELITQSLEDAAKVLAYKVLDTLETDPDPWLLMSLSASQETP